MSEVLLGSSAPVAVVGFGTMGSGIAHLAAAAGHPVLAYDSLDGAVGRGREVLRLRLGQSVAKGRLGSEEAEAILARITPCVSLGDLAPARLVVEAVAEDLEAKREVMRRLEEIVGDDCILATNTSSLSVTAIAAGLHLPGRVVGMHFFNPAPVMPLVEVVGGLATREDVAEAALAIARRWGKTPVRARSTPGFVVNRVARPFYGEALRLLAEGAADVATIDALWREGAGFRMGPFELLDMVGIDVSLAVTESVFAAMGFDPRFAPSLLQQELVRAGHLGRKSGRGFYDYGAGVEPPRPGVVPPQAPPRRVVVAGDLGVAGPLVPAVARAGIAMTTQKTEGPGYLMADGTRLELTDGRMATERAAAELADVVVFDLMLDYSGPGRIAVALADQAPPGALASAAGLLQVAGKTVSVVDDAPGLVVMRTVAMLANIGCDAVHQDVCDGPAVDTAMRLGTGYPRGPMEWADLIGPSTLVAVLDNLARTYGEDRYRASPLLRRRAWSGGSLLEGPSGASR